MRKGESMDYRKSPWFLIIPLLVTLLMVSSCSPNGTQNEGENEREYEGQSLRPPTVQKEAEDALDKIDLEEAQETAQRLAKLATQIKDVNDATAVVLGPWAVVGIDVKATEDRGRIDVIKYSVAEALKDDPAGAYAVVTADPDMLQRLKEMREAIREGEGLQSIMEELADMVGRMMPQFPHHQEEAEHIKQNQDMRQFNKEQEKVR